MAIPPNDFPPRKRRPSASSFISPDFSDRKLLQSLLLLSQEISLLKPLHFLLKQSFSSIIRKSKLLSLVFDEIFRLPVFFLPQSARLCSTELYVVLQRTKTLIEDCSNGSKMWLLMQHKSVAEGFHQLTAEISTLLDVFPFKEFDLSDDVKELVVLLRKQCCRAITIVDPLAENLKQEVLKMLDDIEEAIIPEKSKLENLFERLELRDSSSCRDEIERLEEEVQSLGSTDSKSTVQMLALMGLLRYAKCFLYGASSPKRSLSSPRSDGTNSTTEMSFPADFLCPISLELMSDPVIVATGQTYDRSSISLWIESGRNTCPKTGQVLAHTNLIPNRGLKNLILMWCRENKLPFEMAETDKSNGVTLSKAAVEATRMTASFLVNRLRVSQSTETANRIVHELRTLAKTVSESRACIAESGAIPVLVDHLGSNNPDLQLNAVTTILNLSILESNKTRIMETGGVVDGVVGVLRSGATWEAKGNAAATLYSLSSVHAYRKELGKKKRVVNGLVELARVGPASQRRDALASILNLAGERGCIGKLIEGGVLKMAVEIMDESPEEVVSIMAVMAKRGGAMAIATTDGAIAKLATVLTDGPEGAKESAAAALDTVCRRGGNEVVVQLAAMPRIQKAIWDLMRTGTMRSRRKAASLWRTVRQWAAETNHNHIHHQGRVVQVITNMTDLFVS
ncbi:U-box domain-containing protein 16-like [Macadamia integrifolia]|uniref:U-box domain-containing protein 16-like n=1 Tax=Macadamia integrifolia TaxID=60698 RepID=UPI001C4E3753|nr:U-box domain-containing protein 16-like [Macadamia integrifolia]